LASRGRQARAAGGLAILALLAAAAPASASITVGQVSSTPPGAQCSVQVDVIPVTVGSGNTYTMPEAGTLTSWTTNSRTGIANQMLTMKVFRDVTPTTYLAVGHDGPRNLSAAGGTAGNTFASSVAVKAGDLLGVNSANGGAVANGCNFSTPVGSIGVGPMPVPPGGDVADGGQGTFTTIANHLPNVSAELVPSNSVKVGATSRSKKKGTATVTLDVPNPGVLSLAGKGLKSPLASAPLQISGPGPVPVLIKAKGKQRKKLNQTGVVKLKGTISFTPTAGDTGTTPFSLKLKKKV
jgi:hypothetical protein